MHRELERILEADGPETARTAFAGVEAEFGKPAARALEILRTACWTRSSCPRCVIRIFPNERSTWRLMGALFALQHEDRIAGKRYFDTTKYWDWKAELSRNDSIEEGSGSHFPFVGAITLCGYCVYASNSQATLFKIEFYTVAGIESEGPMQLRALTTIESRHSTRWCRG